jgi:N-methylhydantoinase A
MATSPLRLDNASAYKQINTLFKKIEAEGIRHLQDDGFKKSQIESHRSVEMRYVGQVHECTVDIGNFEINSKSIDKIKEAFHRRHEELYTYSERHNTIELVNIESTLHGKVEKPGLPKLGKGVPVAKALKGHRKAIFDMSGKPHKTPVYDGSLLGAGAQIKGPAVIEEETTTIVIEPGWKASLDKTGSYVISAKAGAKSKSKSKSSKPAKAASRPSKVPA